MPDEKRPLIVEDGVVREIREGELIKDSLYLRGIDEIDGGHANSIYLLEQNISGGGA